MEETLSLTTILSVLNSPQNEDLEMVLMLLNGVQSYKHFNEDQNNRIVSALEKVIGRYRTVKHGYYINTLGNKIPTPYHIMPFLNIINTRVGVKKDPRFSKMTSFKQVKLLVKKMLAKLEEVQKNNEEFELIEW